MNVPVHAGPGLDSAAWQRIRKRAMFECCKWDPQAEDQSVLARYPLSLAHRDWQLLSTWAAQLSVETLAAEEEILQRPELHRELGLPARLLKLFKRRRILSQSAARVMRFDFHFTTDGWKISEVNSDVPGGFIESSGFSRLMGEALGAGAVLDPAARYVDAILKAAGCRAMVALVHATAHTDDRQVMEYLGKLLRAQGASTFMVSPSHLRWSEGRAQLSSDFAQGTPNILVRFFPAEWLPALGQEDLWAPFFIGALTPQSNPGTALLVQSKRFPLLWGRLRTDVSTWRMLLPETNDPRQRVRDGKSDWVLKPALGRVGAGIGIAGVTTAKEWRTISWSARLFPKHWVTQRRFQIVPIQTCEGERFPCVGVFTVDGRVAGVYGRVARKPLIDHEAQDAAVFIQ